MNAILSIIIMAVMALIGDIVGGFWFNDASTGPILFALISGIACIIQAINHKPTDTEE